VLHVPGYTYHREPRLVRASNLEATPCGISHGRPQLFGQHLVHNDNTGVGCFAVLVVAIGYWQLAGG
jgi:hypothetical protein